MYETKLKKLCQRYSNNSKPRFSDEEIITIYLFVGSEFGITTVKGIHNFARELLSDWFPGLVSYQTFVYRLNKMAGTLGKLNSELICSSRPTDCMEDDIIADSCPIMTCHGRSRNGRVATEIADKGYNATREQFYCGLKLHIAAYRRDGRLPDPCIIALSPASESDLTVFRRDILPNLTGKHIYADKGYADRGLWEYEERVNGNILLSPPKTVKGSPACIRQMDKAANDLLAHAVSSVRDSIEALFSWLNEKTGIQRASLCRSTSGLLVHILGKIAIAFIPRVLNYNFNY
ncbi:MAG: transposase [Bacteroidales bacterium]|nr:transposase [Bacteroidales bacterium]